MKNKFDISKQELEKLLAFDGHPTDISEAEAAEKALLGLAAGYELIPPLPLKNKVLDKLRQLKQQTNARTTLDINNLPLLSATSNWLDWKELVKDINPPDDFEDLYLHTLELNNTRELSVVWVREYVPEEVHEDLLESFLILEGGCECEITNSEGDTRTVRLSEGDFITMQIGETHNIRITSQQPTKAILQWLKVA
ncbi:MAG: cupin domain-containing protein [Sphingobacteriales bacterium]|nr:MAG: cupin domain-containing protein [Sphingobacteriales bacterium]